MKTDPKGIYEEYKKADDFKNSLGAKGIAEQSRINERFYRGDSSRTRETGGSGIGLSIAKTVTDAHKGKISCTVEGERVTFKVKLPLKPADKKASKRRLKSE